MAHAVTLIPGDWIGPETTRVVQDILRASGVRIDWETFACNDGLVSDELLLSAQRTGRVLMNRLESPRVAGRLPASVLLRKRLGLWAQVREVKNLPGLPARFTDIDLIVVRETSEDIYKGFEHQTAPGVYESVKVTTQAACERIARFAFELAQSRGRRKVSIVHKANIMKKSDGLLLRTALAVAADYPDIQHEDVIVDALCMRMVRWPSSFDVLMCGNLFGDIVSDLAAGLAGGITVGGALNHSETVRIFENPHGKAPGLVGTGRANPLPNLMAAVKLLEDLGEAEAAARIQAAVQRALLGGLLTVDRGGEMGCEAVRDVVVAGL